MLLHLGHGIETQEITHSQERFSVQSRDLSSALLDSLARCRHEPCDRSVARAAASVTRARETERKTEEESGASSSRDSEVAFASPCCGRSAACECCLSKSRSRTIVTTQASAPERPAPQALPPTDPFADLFGVSLDGAPLAAVPDVPPARPARILLGVWRN